MMDFFKTIEIPSKETLFKEKGSKFFAYAFPVTTEEDIKDILLQLQKQHFKARHCCYAWRLGTNPISYRANDDGEPTNTAGQPILGQLQSFEITNTLVVVVRYFGGVKLGVGGLIKAYRSAAKECLESCKIIEKQITDSITITFNYDLLSDVMRIVKLHDLAILNQKFEAICLLNLEVVQSQTNTIREVFDKLYGVSLTDK